MHGGASPQVKRKAAERLADLIDPDRALRELAALAYADPRALFDDDGNLKPIHKLPAHVAASIGKLEVIKKNAEAGDGHIDTVHKIAMWDKPKALSMLLQHLGLLEARIQVTVVDERAKRLEEGRARVALLDVPATDAEILP